MRHRKLSQRLSRVAAHRKATLRNLVINLLKYQRIKTTRAKAHFAQPLAERIISLGRKNTLQSRRDAFRLLGDRTTVNTLFSRICPLFKNKTSGFSRIIHYSKRRGDGAELVFLELTEKSPVAKPKKEKEKETKEAKGKKPEKAAKKPQAEVKPEAKPQEKQRFPKEKSKLAKGLKPKKFLGGLRKLFKKERDSL